MAENMVKINPIISFINQLFRGEMDTGQGDISKYRDDFESKGRENGFHFWYARDFMEMLGYDNYETFRKAINKATQACIALNIQVADNFVQDERDIDGHKISDIKLSRFACYLVAMNGDVRKKQVAMMQAYFAGLAEIIRQYIQKGENVDRLIIRDELKERVGVLTHVAKIAEVKDYGLFQNAGYRGMYNMNLGQLIYHKGLKKGDTLFDFMGSTELAANLFRITQTSEKIKNENIKGQMKLEATAESVGRAVRKTMLETSGIPPENLKIQENIKDVRKKLKSTHKELRKIDKPKKQIKKKSPDK